MAKKVKAISEQQAADRPVVTLTLKEGMSGHDTFVSLNQYNKDSLCSIVELLLTVLHRSTVEYSKGTRIAVRQLMDKMLAEGPRSLKKDELMKVIRLFCINPCNLVQVADGPLPALRTVWTRLITGADGISMGKIGSTLSLKPGLANTGGWSTRYMPDVLLWPATVECEYSYRYYGTPDISGATFFLSNLHRAKMAKVFLGEQVLDAVVTETIDDDRVETLDYEKDIVTDLYFMSALKSTGQLGSWEDLTQARLKSFCSKLRMNEFPTCKTENDLSRKRLFAIAYCEFADHYRNPDMTEGNEADVATFARFVAKQLGRTFDTIEFGVLLPAFKGFTKTLVHGNRARLIISNILGLIKPSAKGWLDMSNFQLRYLCGDHLITQGAGYTGLFIPSSYDRQKSLRPSDVKVSEMTHGHSSFDLWGEITFPFVVHILRALCGMGLLQLAVDPQAAGTDPMEGIRFVRLTELGKYAMGLTDVYTEPQDAKTEPSFEFDEDNLIVTVLDKDSPFTYFLAKIGRRIGPNRYHITAKGIIERSACISEANRSIEIFTHSICPEPRGRWKEMIDEAHLRIQAVVPPGANYRLVKLNPDTPGLIDLVAHNAELARNSLKAQQNCLLVKSDYYTKFRLLLATNGYLID